MHLLLASTTAGYQTRAFAAAAGTLGVRLTLATDRCEHLDDALGAVPVKLDDPHRYAEALEAHGPFTGVVALGDRTTMLAAVLAERCGLRFHPPAAVDAAGSKYLTKERFRAAGMTLPQYRRWAVETNPGEAAAVTAYPCVLKPLAMTGSRGVIRADDASGFVAAFHRIRALLEAKDRYIQVESFIPGEEFAIEGLVTGGRLRVLALFDKPDPLNGPYFEETIYVTPSRQPAATQRAIVEEVERGVSALGLTDGPIHAEARVNGGGVYVLEIAARPIGGLCARALRFTGGMPLEELILRHALGQDTGAFELDPAPSGVLMIPIPRAGIYKDVAGLEEASAVDGIEEIRITAKEGQLLRMFPEASSYLGFVFSRGPRALAALRDAHRLLRFDIARELTQGV